VSPALIGLIGYKRSGKNTVADVLAEEFAYRPIAFADALREAVLALDPIIGTFPLTVGDVLQTAEWRLSEVLDAIGYEKAKEIPEVRRVYQRFGTDAIRKLDADFWLRIGTQRIDAILSGAADRAEGKFDATGASVVVTDVRFPNEADAIRERGGYIVRVVRPGFEPEDGAHESETALDDYRPDVILYNSRDLDHLASGVLSLGRLLDDEPRLLT
jgi:hypothetical protein